MKFYYIPLYIVLLFAGPRVFAQYETYSLDWNINAYQKLIFISGLDTMPYRLLKPNNYDPNIKYPLVLMLHGFGEGIGEPCTNQHGINVCNLGWGGKMHLDSLNKYPAFYLFPQTTHGFWSASTDYTGDISRPLRMVTLILTQLFNTYNIDLNRVYGHGLCAGGMGIWDLAGRYPNLFAAISPHVTGGNPNNAALYVNTPVWGAQGEFDTDPDPAYAFKNFQTIEKNGRPVIYTLNEATSKQNWPNPNQTNGKNYFSYFPMVGHEAWPKLYNSPSWLAWMFSQSKLSITVYGKTNIYNGESVKLEMAAGFDAYEWSTGATTRSITVTQPGSYKARVKRKASFFTGTSNFTDWTSEVVITIKPGVKDVTKPSVPANLISTEKTLSSISMAWNPSTDNVGVVRYRIYINNKVSDSTSLTTYTANNLFPGTSYAFKVAAVDSQGNSSNQSTELAVITNNNGFGLAYNYYEWNFSVLPDFDTIPRLLRKSGYITNFSLDPKKRSDYFAFKYDGYIDIPTTGNYTFYTNSDDGSRLYIDNVLVVDNDGLHGSTEKFGTVNNLTKGKHSIRVTYFESSDSEGLQVKFNGPGITKRIIPDTSLYVANVKDSIAPSTPANLKLINKTVSTAGLSWDPSTDDYIASGYQIFANGVYKQFSLTNTVTITDLQPGTSYTFSVRARDPSNNLSGFSNTVNVTTIPMTNGVKYSYYEGSFLSLPDFTTLTPVKTDYITNFSLSPRMKNDSFAFKYDGYIQIINPGTYTFYTSSNDGSKLFINGNLIVNNDGQHSEFERNGSINLPAGKHAISVTYFEKIGLEALNVKYAGPGVTKQLIPTEVLFIKNTNSTPNKNPVIASITNQTMNEGTTLNIPISATDADGDSIILSIQNSLPFATITDNKNGTGQLTFKPGYSAAGVYSITVLAYDGKGGADNKSFTLTIVDAIPVNSNPIITAISDKSMDIGTSLNVTVSATDADGDIINLTAPNLPSFGTFSSTLGNGQLTFNPGLNDAGTYIITVNASDGKGGTDSKTFSLTVLKNTSVNGVAYSYYEGIFTAVPNYNSLSPVKTGFVPNFSLAPKNNTDRYSFKYSSYIQISTAGNYTFYTNSNDGSKLFIDGALIVNNDGLHATQEKNGTVNLIAGRHAIEVDFIQYGGGELLSVSYAGPGISKTQIPDAVLYLNNISDQIAPSTPTNLISTGKTATSVDLSWDASTDNVAVSGYNVLINGVFNAFVTTNNYTVVNLNLGTTYNFTVQAKDAANNLSDISNSLAVTTNTTNIFDNGVNYSYYEGVFSSVPNFNAVSSVKTGVVSNFTTTPKNNTDKFSFRYTSYIQINTAGNYTFYTNSNDGSKLLINGIVVVSNDGLHAAQERSGTINLIAGRHAIEVDFIQNGGAELLNVSYAGPGILKQAIPDNILFLNNTNVKIASGQEANESMEPMKNLVAYPNPFENIISIIINPENEGLLKVYDNSGNLILQREVKTGEQHLDLTNFTKGYFYIKIYGKNGNKVPILRIVKN